MDALDALMRVLYQQVGNKRYMGDIERLLERAKPHLTADDLAAIRYLIRDLQDLSRTSDQRKPYETWRR